MNTQPNLTVRSKVVLEHLGEDVYSYAVQVVDQERPWLEIRLRVREWTDADIVFFRLANVRIVSEDSEDAKPTLVLAEGEWWAAVLDAVLEHIAFQSTALDHANERADGGVFTYVYGWEDGVLREAEIHPSGPLGS